MSSWQPYIDNDLVGTGLVSEAGTYGFDKGDMWAVSPGFSVQDKEVQEIISAFSDPNRLFSVGSSFHVNGIKYFILAADDHSIVGKADTTGICISRNDKAVLFGTYDENIQATECIRCVEDLANQLNFASD